MATTSVTLSPAPALRLCPVCDAPIQGRADALVCSARCRQSAYRRRSRARPDLDEYNILVACEKSGVVRDAFRARGYAAISCDLQPTDTPGPHITGDVTELLSRPWALVIAHPPCTYLTTARGKHRRPDEEAAAIAFFLACLNANAPRVAVENPARHYRTIREQLGAPTQKYHPWHFGLIWQGAPSRRYLAISESHRKEWERLAEAERHAVHRLSSDTISALNPGDTVGVEDLRIQNLLKNHHLARAISDQSWGALLKHLEYKAENAGLRFVKVDPKHTSQLCSGCGSMVPKPLSVRVHACPDCGLVLDRDENAAINILRRAVIGDAGGAKRNPALAGAPGGAQDSTEPAALAAVSAEIRFAHGPPVPA